MEVSNGVDGKILAVCISDKRGIKKKALHSCLFIKDYGIQEDAHAGNWHRQVSMLGIESINKMKEKGLKVGFGDFAENITTEGIELVNLTIGSQIKIGKEVVLELTQIGKECHTPCNIYYQAGDCVMPKEGVFGKVIHGGIVNAGDKILILA